MSHTQGVPDLPTEAVDPQRIGSGSFATIFVVRGQPFVFKVVQHQQRADELAAEFNVLHSLYSSCNSDSIFAIPRAIAYHNPATNDFLFFPPSPPIGRKRDPRPDVHISLFEPLRTGSAAYAMDRAHVVPSAIGTIIRQLFYPGAFSDAPPPYLCRLYFGRQVRPSKFLNPVNFPVDAARYTVLYAQPDIPEMLPIDEVAAGMGEMLARVHWRTGYDARDIEFVMGGSGYGAVRYYVIDFNQMRRFDVKDDPIDVLVDPFFTNDPYYPRPRTDDALYTAFKAGYVAACPGEWRARGQEFLAAIEAGQAERDTSP